MKKEQYEELLYNEILVDCSHEYEQNMSWYYYVQDELEFPFEATINIRKRDGSKISKRIKVIDLSSDDTNFERNFNIEVAVEFDDYLLEIALEKLDEISASEKTIEIINTWKYWIKK